MTYRKPGKNAQMEAELRKPPGPPVAWEYGLPVPETPWEVLKGEKSFPAPMPWWYPLMHLDAAVGRAVLKQDRETDG